MAIFTAGIGPSPIKDGSTPVVAHEDIFAIGLRNFFSASSLVIITIAAAPSFKPDEFPAVTVPSFLNTDSREFNFSKSRLALGYSSLSKIKFLLSFLTCNFIISF